MRIVLCTALAALLPLETAAQQRPIPERWIYAKASGGALGYEATTIARDPATGEAYGITFLYLVAAQTGQGLTYNYQLLEHEYDCRGKRIKLLGYSLFDGKGMEIGAFDVTVPDWQPAASNGVQGLLIDIICGEANLSAAQEDASMEAAFSGAAALSGR